MYILSALKRSMHSHRRPTTLPRLSRALLLRPILPAVVWCTVQTVDPRVSTSSPEKALHRRIAKQEASILPVMHAAHIFRHVGVIRQADRPLPQRRPRHLIRQHRCCVQHNHICPVSKEARQQCMYHSCPRPSRSVSATACHAQMHPLRFSCHLGTLIQRRSLRDRHLLRIYRAAQSALQLSRRKV